MRSSIYNPVLPELSKASVLGQFLDWTDSSWEKVKPRQVAQFKKYLMRNDPDSGKRVLSDATCCRTLTTLKKFYGWMFRCRYISHDPSIEVDKPKLKEPTAQNLRDDEIGRAGFLSGDWRGAT